MVIKRDLQRAKLYAINLPSGRLNTGLVNDKGGNMRAVLNEIEAGRMLG